MFLIGIAKPVKAPAKVEKAKDKSLVGSVPLVPLSDAGQFVEEILDKTSALLLSEVICIVPLSDLALMEPWNLS